MNPPDLFAALGPVLEVLHRLGVRHYVGGLIASSAHGLPRASIDADVVAELLPGPCGALCGGACGHLLRARGDDARGDCSNHRSFNVIHLDRMIKVDVFVARDRPFDQRALERVRAATLEGGHVIPVSSPEDTLLAKLEWYRRGGEVSQRQWADVVGLLRVGRDLDERYLREEARELDVADLLQRALDEASR